MQLNKIKRYPARLETYRILDYSTGHTVPSKLIQIIKTI
jgi:hypothetical protein